MDQNFWDGFFLLLIYLPLLLLWGLALVDIFRRGDLSGVARVVWVVVVIVLPFVGTLVYLLSRPGGGPMYESRTMDTVSSARATRYAEPHVGG